MIYTFGDGFAAGHIWPEWPQILEAILQIPVVNYGHIGAGNELIFNCALKSALKARSNDIFLIQWAQLDRFDKIIEDNIWINLQHTDSVYKSINIDTFNQRWWSTSKSDLPEIKKYNNFYVQKLQALNRSVLYMISLSNTLKLFHIKHLYFSTYQLDFSGHENYEDIKNLPWVDFDGMELWSKNIPARGKEIQPSPIVHYRYIIEKILPNLDIKLKPEFISDVDEIINNFTFIPYHYDRAQQWENIKNEINMLR